MRTANILALATIAIWAWLLWAGVDLLEGVVAQHVLGSPTPGQFEFLVGIPFAAIVAISGVTLLVNALNRYAGVAHFVIGVGLIAVVPYLFVYGGGV